MALAAAIFTEAADWHFPRSMVLPLIYWILVCSVAGYYAVTWAMRHLPASQVRGRACWCRWRGGACACRGAGIAFPALVMSVCSSGVEPLGPTATTVVEAAAAHTL